MGTHVQPSWPTEKRTTFQHNLPGEESHSPLPGVKFLSDLVKGIDVKRQTGYTDEDLPQPFRNPKSYSHVPHELLAPDGFPKSKYWLHPACKFAVPPIEKKSGKGALVQSALDYYREYHYPGVPAPRQPTPRTSRRQKPRHPAKGTKVNASRETDQSAGSENRKQKTYDRSFTRLDDPLLPFEDYDRTMEIIFNCYTVVTHGRSQFVDRDSDKLICTFAYEDLEAMPPDQRQLHQQDVTTILMATQLFNRLPLPKKELTSALPNPSEPAQLTAPVSSVQSPIHHPSRSDSPPPALATSTVSSPLTSLSPSETDETNSLPALNLRQSPPCSPFPMGTSQPLTAESLATLEIQRSPPSSPLTSLPPSDTEAMALRTVPVNKRCRYTDTSTKKGFINIVGKVRKPKAKPTTNGALINGAMYCFGQTVGYSSDILLSPYLPHKCSSRPLYEKFLERLPAFARRISPQTWHSLC
ncbi:uncharacterized protein MELLADRAFT_87760 [Melampsora larici-populina 98AG31]|uniref:Uncharacterized protein n=1 Tax=Melampsora larici-populina (strain 98AG31 / pathotype 3-4-7) TaxID=747676 RepID=F4SDY5_MELLP|nr:uncharacterized protein MELLADRAFT_87760 [Melampsora larici-populina 98AG31]EGF97140.1 hypothetical protein MELLADRAFT_87760 [Melampsora larici-populina 98AG31]